MSLPPQVDKAAKHRPVPMKEAVHQAEVYYGLGPSTLDPGLSDMSAGTSAVYNPEKVPQNLGHYHQQPAQVKWMHQDTSMQGSGWAQEAQLPGWGQNFASYMGGVNVRGFHKGLHEGLSMGAENQMQDVFRDNTQWDPMHQLQSYHQQQQQQQQHAQTLQAPMLQSFQTFRQNKPQQQQFNPGYYTGFTQKQAPMQSLGYAEQPKQQQQPLLHQIQQQQQQIHHHQQQQQQQLQMQQHLQQQHQRQMQTQYHQQHMQERHVQPIPQISQQTVQQDMQVAPKLNFVSYERQDQPETKIEASAEPPQQQQQVPVKEMLLEKVDQAESISNTLPAAQPRRSRRLSREGQSPGTEQPQNGLAAMPQRVGESQGTTGGVIQSTHRRRRASKEINLETLAQQAAKRESLPAKVKEDAPSGRQSSMAPLVIPVSVPVPAAQQQGPLGEQEPEGGWSAARPRTSDRSGGQSLHKPSVIVARRRSLRNSLSERTVQDVENDSGTDEEGKPRPKRRPRPGPLIIPPPRPSSFIPPSVYSSITPYQSHLRSPVHPQDHPVMVPPYTPPPILSPVRAGSGLYFSTFLSNMAAAGTQVLPPPTTIKPVSISLLRLPSLESTPPLPIVTDATPVSLEPRINIGQQYQAEIPDLLSPSSSQLDQHQADLLWLPMEQEIQHGGQDSMRDLMNLACSSVLSGGGTNQELVLHNLFQSRGDVLVTLERLMLQDVRFSKGHPLFDYHYSGSDSWTPEEKRYFNKGISAYRKDFIMVQKLVQTKTVAQCVEFYYTYKKQMKVGRSGTLTFGPEDSALHSHEEVIDNKSSQQPKADLSEVESNHQPEPPCEQSTESRHQAASVTEPNPVSCQPPLQISPPSRPLQRSATPRSRPETQAKKSKAPPKAPADPDQVFPCKKCGRVFTKVKSRSAHMKSHAEQEKKAAALRQKEQEEQAQMRTLPGLEPELGSRPGPETTDQGGAEALGGLYRAQGSGAESSEADDAADEDWH